jgi:dTDP-4-dehydrorhamnose reductase
MSNWIPSGPIKLLVTGAGGQIGSELARMGANDPFFSIIAMDHQGLDITKPDAVRETLDHYLPDYVINTAAFNRVDAAEFDNKRCYQVNTDGVGILAQACSDLSIPIVHLSTDHVFDGHYASGYGEEDEVSPLGVFGDSKYQGEQLLQQHQPKHLILRLSWVFSTRGYNYVLRTLDKARSQKAIEAADDRQGCPTSAKDVARVILAMLKQVENGAESWGIYHYCGAEITTRYRFTEAILAGAGQYEALQTEVIVPVPSKELHTEVERPASSVLKCQKILRSFGIKQKPWRSELSTVLKEIYSTPLPR